jgi:hypothetical protein
MDHAKTHRSVCAARVRPARRLAAQAHQREVVIGSSSMLTPYQYIANLKRIKKADAFGE